MNVSRLQDKIESCYINKILQRSVIYFLLPPDIGLHTISILGLLWVPSHEWRINSTHNRKEFWTLSIIFTVKPEVYIIRKCFLAWINQITQCYPSLKLSDQLHGGPGAFTAVAKGICCEIITTSLSWLGFEPRPSAYKENPLIIFFINSIRIGKILALCRVYKILWLMFRLIFTLHPHSSSDNNLTDSAVFVVYLSIGFWAMSESWISS